MSTAMESIAESPGNITKITRAIISVSDKNGLIEFAQQLAQSGVEIFSTGGTRRHLQDAGISVRDVSDYTGFPEMMDGRVKTLHPKIFAGILNRRDNPTDQQSMQDHDIVGFDLVVVNLYPFRETISKPDVTLAEATEQIDIGGPSLVRAAAKNHKFVTIVTSAAQYDDVVTELGKHGGTSLELRKRLMAEAFQHTADYDITIANYFSASDHLQDNAAALPSQVLVSLEQLDELRYGENSHQRGAVYQYAGGQDFASSIIHAKQLNGKQLSYNNLLDLDSALSMVLMFDQPACSVIKHNNPCGAAVGDNVCSAVQKAFAGDPVSAFGSVVAINKTVDAETAAWMSDAELFVEAVVAPEFEPAALEILTTRPKWKKNVRLMALADIERPANRLELRPIYGGMLIQDSDSQLVQQNQWKIVTDSQPSEQLLNELQFGWNMVRFVKSNAITLSKDLSLVGVGAGQMSRVDSVNISIEKAGDRAAGSVLSSDAFFPFPDSIELAAKAGVAAIIQPGGSVKDDEVIAACNNHGIPMVFAGTRHFKH